MPCSNNGPDDSEFYRTQKIIADTFIAKILQNFPFMEQKLKNVYTYQAALCTACRNLSAIEINSISINDPINGLPKFLYLKEWYFNHLLDDLKENFNRKEELKFYLNELMRIIQ